MNRLSVWVSGPNQYYPRPKGQTWLSECRFLSSGNILVGGNVIYIKYGQQLSEWSNEKSLMWHCTWFGSVWSEKTWITEISAAESCFIKSYVNNLQLNIQMENSLNDGISWHLPCEYMATTGPCLTNVQMVVVRQHPPPVWVWDSTWSSPDCYH